MAVVPAFGLGCGKRASRFRQASMMAVEEGSTYLARRANPAVEGDLHPAGGQDTTWALVRSSRALHRQRSRPR
jgi:hypothetical protein